MSIFRQCHCSNKWFYDLGIWKYRDSLNCIPKKNMPLDNVWKMSRASYLTRFYFAENDEVCETSASIFHLNPVTELHEYDVETRNSLFNWREGGRSKVISLFWRIINKEHSRRLLGTILPRPFPVRCSMLSEHPPHTPSMSAAQDISCSAFTP